MDNQDAGWRTKFAGAALLLAVFGVVWFMIAALGSKYGLWSWQFGLMKMTFNWGPKIVMAGGALSVLALIIAFVKAPRKRPAMLALAAILVSLLSFGRLAAMKGQGERLPPLHDIQTNWDAPIQPSAELVAVRTEFGALNPILDAPTVPEGADARWPGTGGRLVSELQQEAEFNPETQKSAKAAPYPKIDTLAVSVPLAEAYAATKAALEAAGMEIVTDNAADGQLEATATTGWFGFKDDVMVRIIPTAGMEGALIDARSTSRVGLSDLGANAKRLRNLLDDIERRVS